MIDKGRLVLDAPVSDITRTAEGCEKYRYRIETPSRGAAFTAVKALSRVRHVVVSDLPSDGAYTFSVEAEGDPTRDLFALCAREGWPLVEAKKEDASLEELFLRIVDGAKLPTQKNGKGKRK
jgi:ABC-2 type transport system ATP-binding protein